MNTQGDGAVGGADWPPWTACVRVVSERWRQHEITVIPDLPERLALTPVSVMCVYRMMARSVMYW